MASAGQRQDVLFADASGCPEMDDWFDRKRTAAMFKQQLTSIIVFSL
jgi:hypothetical protein